MKNLLLLLFLTSPVLAQNSVLELDGQESYVHLPGHIFDHLEEATVEAWVKWEDWAPFSQWFAFGANGQFRAMGVNNYATTSDLQFFIYTGEGKENATWNTRPLRVLRLAADLPLGQWCHMAAVTHEGLPSDESRTSHQEGWTGTLDKLATATA